MKQKYTLKTYFGDIQLERYDRKSISGIQQILENPQFRKPSVGPFGEVLKHTNKFEIYDVFMTHIFTGNLVEAIAFMHEL